MASETLIPNSQWVEYYANKPVNAKRISEIAIRHNHFFDRILHYSPAYAFEVGIGTGIMGYSLLEKAKIERRNIQVIELDINQKLLADAKKFLGSSDLYFVTGDTFQIPFSDAVRNKSVVYHQGLLEHFSNEQLYRMIQEQLRISSTVVASVPSSTYNFKEGLRGDERLMDLEGWQSALAPFTVKGDSYGENPGETYHLCLTITE